MRIQQTILGVGLTLGLSLAGTTPRAASPTYGQELEGFAYPWPVKDFAFTSQGEAMIGLEDWKAAAARARQDSFEPQAGFAALTMTAVWIKEPDMIACSFIRPRLH